DTRRDHIYIADLAAIAALAGAAATASASHDRQAERIEASALDVEELDDVATSTAGCAIAALAAEDNEVCDQVVIFGQRAAVDHRTAATTGPGERVTAIAAGVVQHITCGDAVTDEAWCEVDDRAASATLLESEAAVAALD